MSVISTVDEKLAEARGHIRQAAELLSTIVVDEWPDRSSFYTLSDIKADLDDIGRDLNDIKKELA